MQEVICKYYCHGNFNLTALKLSLYIPYNTLLAIFIENWFNVIENIHCMKINKSWCPKKEQTGYFLLELNLRLQFSILYCIFTAFCISCSTWLCFFFFHKNLYCLRRWHELETCKIIRTHTIDLFWFTDESFDLFMFILIVPNWLFGIITYWFLAWIYT